MERRLGALHAALAEAGAPSGDLPAALTAVAEATFAFAAAERTFYRLYLTLWFAPIRSEAYDVARAFHERHFAAVERIFREAAGEKGAPRGRSRARAAAFLGLLNNHVGLALNNYAALNPRLARETTHAFLYGVARGSARGEPHGGGKPPTLPPGT